MIITDKYVEDKIHGMTSAGSLKPLILADVNEALDKQERITFAPDFSYEHVKAFVDQARREK